MPISHEIDESLGLVLTVATGVLTDNDILCLKDRLVADPRWRPGMRELSDIRAIEKLAVTSQGVKAMVAHDVAHADRTGRYRLAIVAPQTAVFGMARMYETLGSNAYPAGPAVSVFRDMATARAWLAEGD